jgi:hypothetical protein
MDLASGRRSETYAYGHTSIISDWKADVRRESMRDFELRMRNERLKQNLSPRICTGEHGLRRVN